jgi:hypothetical protein
MTRSPVLVFCQMMSGLLSPLKSRVEEFRQSKPDIPPALSPT